MSTQTSKKPIWRPGSGDQSPMPGNLTIVRKSDVEQAFAQFLANRMRDAREDLARWLASKVDEGGTFVIAADRPRFLFRKAGCVWRVVFDGGPEFFIHDNLGAKYLDWFFRNPNESIHAFDLEQRITPDKESIRPRDSIQERLDPAALKNYRSAIDDLNVELKQAQASGSTALCTELEIEIQDIRTQLHAGGELSDAGRKARDNVRKAIATTKNELRSGEKPQKDFLRHIDTLISTGYQCEYAQAEGKIWE